ncbi:MAG: hypothetical protein U9R48_06495 [Chloroflexota bacterium]|nr:hypothetical protein [Chloroflexota bacterium]
MNYIISLLPWLIPCMGAFLTAALPLSSYSRVRRWGHTAILVGTSVAFALVQGAMAPELGRSFPLMEYSALAFSYAHPGTMVGWLPLGLLTLTNLGLIREPLGRLESAGQLALAGGMLATVAASNAFTLGVTWSLTDLMLLALKLRDAHQEEPHLLMRYGASNLLSTMALVVGIALVGRWETALPAYAFAKFPAASLPWLALAAFLRLGVYPLPNRHGGTWEIDLVSLYTGIYLWLQVSMAHPLALARLPMLFIALSLLAAGLLATHAVDFGSGWPYVSMYSVLLSLFPVLVGGDAGAAVTLSLTSLWALCLTLRHLYISASVPKMVAPWWRVPMMIALAALSGLPPTLGFTARWSLLRLCWLDGRWGLILTVSVASLLVSTMLWQQLDKLLALHGDYERLKWPKRIPLGAASLLAAALMVSGVCPTCLGPIWPGQGTALLPFSEGIKQVAVPLLLTLIPALGAYALHILRSRLSLDVLLRLEGVDALLGLEWLYGGMEMVSQRTGAGIRQLYRALEEALGLGWILMWALALTLYLVER